ncbi:MAG: CAP domain-containing protein, partial [Candidatus Kerfeldbacteria bacterium]|nr:CAP domain-containing protein [Candidatus Kerfeldbacteria bacterium]
RVNRERSARDLAPLRQSRTLQQAAYRKARSLVRAQYFGHVFGNQSLRQSLGVRARFTHLGENLALGFAGARPAVRGFMASTPHRRNLLSQRYTHVGVAVVDGYFYGKRTTLVVQVFGRQHNVQPRPEIRLAKAKVRMV